jgi:hypothetical protein
VRLVLVVLVGAVVWTGRGLFLRAQQGTREAPKMTAAQVETLLPIQQGLADHVRNVRCTPVTGAFDYACTFVSYGTTANMRSNRGGKLFKVGVEDHNGHTVTGQIVRPDAPLGPAPPR